MSESSSKSPVVDDHDDEAGDKNSCPSTPPADPHIWSMGSTRRILEPGEGGVVLPPREEVRGTTPLSLTASDEETSSRLHQVKRAINSKNENMKEGTWSFESKEPTGQRSQTKLRYRKESLRAVSDSLLEAAAFPPSVRVGTVLLHRRNSSATTVGWRPDPSPLLVPSPSAPRRRQSLTTIEVGSSRLN